MVLTVKFKFKEGNTMPKIDPDDADTSATTTAPAPLPAGQTSTSSTSLFGASTPTSGSTNGFGSSTPASTGAFGSASANSFGSSAGGFGGSSSTGTSAFGSSSSGFGSTSSGFGGSTGGFGGGMNSGMGGQQTNGMASAEAANALGNVMAASAGHEPEHWMKSFWRPAMGWLYMLICFMDFVAFPLISMFLPIIERGFGLQMGYTAWQSLTLSNGGLIHLAFGGILGVSAFGRTQEKKAGAT
jgi:hypothetical protein